MRFLAIVVAGLCSIAPAIALAESGEELRARGEQLAKDGRFTEAIDAFKAAERLEPRARHSCLIALAYTRIEYWPQAEIFLAECEARATPADPVPEWVPMAKQQLVERLASVNVAPVEIKVEPAGVDVKLAVSSFAPDELFGPRTIHLRPGRQTIIATAKGYNDAQKTIDVPDDRSPQTVTITMLPVGEGKPGGGGGGIVTGHAAPASKVPLVLMATGGGLVVVGAALHVFYFKPARDDLKDAKTQTDYNTINATNKFEKSRNITLAVYGVGAATLVTGLILKFTVFKQKEAPVQVGVTPHDGGGVVTVGWSR
ncbi:MAG: hypothetical protein IPQ07_22110 [Myxococcales bacterium]|nr:hypothetical protein [Myxococcales bacterium]